MQLIKVIYLIATAVKTCLGRENDKNIKTFKTNRLYHNSPYIPMRTSPNISRNGVYRIYQGNAKPSRNNQSNIRLLAGRLQNANYITYNVLINNSKKRTSKLLLK